MGSRALKQAVVEKERDACNRKVTATNGWDVISRRSHGAPLDLTPTTTVVIEMLRKTKTVQGVRSSGEEGREVDGRRQKTAEAASDITA